MLEIKIRLELIPYMENNFNKDIIHTLNRMSNIIKEDNEYLERDLMKYLKNTIIEKMIEL